MLKTYNNILSEIDIDFILNLPEVKKAKEDIDRKIEGFIYFSIELLPEIHEKIFEIFNINLSHVPMRWIKGDTKPHIDQGENTFNKSHLLYLTDSEGEFLINNESYPIQKNTAYIFSEGLRHETINTGSEPRLLLGPMSEQGFAVGAASIITADGANQTIYFNYTEGSVYYNINGGTNMDVSFPITIINSNTSSSTLKVLFETNITISTSIFYFICGSAEIQFGSTSLNTDGSRPIFTVNEVANYPGLIQNGTSSSIGFENIHVFNIKVEISNGSTLAEGGGWIGHEYFGKSAMDCYIINCSSDGDISDNSGGIVGSYAGEGQENESSLKIIGCSSSGIIGSNSGGIVGNYAAQNTGNVRCETCWSTGQIGAGSGGIFASNAGDTSGSTTASNCYSEGLINTNGGGIFGAYAGNPSDREAIAENCYSRGNISGDAGGIFGAEAKSTSSATNCYSIGTIVTAGNGIYGTDPQAGYTLLNCYSADGTWNTTTADSELLGIPITPNRVGQTWVATIEDEPYEILLMGYTPYTIENIVSFEGSPILNKEIEPTGIYQGSSTNAAIISGKSYEIIEYFEGGTDPASFSTITIDSNTGVISTTSSTTPGTYPLAIRNNGSYNFSVVILTVLENPTPTPTIQRDNSFRVYNLLLDEVQNNTYLAQSGTYGSYNNSFTIYDIIVLELVNQALLDE
jgi:hypothetical protein